MPAESLVLDTNCKKVFVIPATIQLAGAEIELVSAIARETRLKDLLDADSGRVRFLFSLTVLLRSACLLSMP